MTKENPIQHPEILPNQNKEVLKFKDFNRIVFVDDKPTTYGLKLEGYPHRGDYYRDLCSYFSKLGMDSIDIVLVVGDGLFTYDKTDNRLIKDDSAVVSFPSSASNRDSTEQLSNLIIKQKKEKTLFIVDNRLADDETDYNNGIFSRDLLKNINNAGGYTIRTSEDKSTESPYKTESKEDFGFKPQLTVASPSVFANTITRTVNGATQG